MNTRLVDQYIRSAMKDRLVIERRENDVLISDGFIVLAIPPEQRSISACGTLVMGDQKVFGSGVYHPDAPFSLDKRMTLLLEKEQFDADPQPWLYYTEPLGNHARMFSVRGQRQRLFVNQQFVDLLGDLGDYRFSTARPERKRVFGRRQVQVPQALIAWIGDRPVAAIMPMLINPTVKQYERLRQADRALIEAAGVSMGEGALR